MMTLTEFDVALCLAADASFEARLPGGTGDRGGGSGPGPHYGVRGVGDEMLSPSLEELTVLFLLARAWRPEVVVEYGTGTGLSAAAMALGWPPAQIVTADRFGMHDCEVDARTAWLGLDVDDRICLERGDWGKLPALSRREGWRVGLVFADGDSTYPGVPGFPGARPDALYVVHDFGGFRGGFGRGWFLDTSSVLGLWAVEPDVAARAAAVASLVVPAGRVHRVGEKA